jgi:hypothetical protein
MKFCQALLVIICNVRRDRHMDVTDFAHQCMIELEANLNNPVHNCILHS